MKYVGCFAFNKSSEQVQDVGLPILSTLEYVIHDEVMPTCPVDPAAQFKAFPGISNLMIDYLKILKKIDHLDRAARFISSLTGAVLIEAIRNISLLWNRVIPEPFVKIVETAAASGSPEEQEIANWALHWQRRTTTIQEEELAISHEDASP
jgi:hypothetical protein